jgi:carbohydrate kinase, pfkB family
MDPRLDRAQGPTIGFAFGHVLTMDALVENGDEAASLSERILALLRLQNSAEKPSFPSMKVPSHRLAQLLVHAAQAGSYTSTCGRQAFADAVWNYCEDEEPHCREFQAATLVAAAVSLGLDSPNLRVEDTLVRAIDVAASLEARGEWSPEPDVVAATRRAMNIVSNMNEYPESPFEYLVEQIGATGSLSQIVPMAFALASRYQDRRILTSPLRLGVHSSTILSTACSLVGAVRGAAFLRSYGARVVEESLRFDPKESAKNILSGRIPYPGDLLVPDEPSHPIAPSGPSSFEDTDSGESTRQRYFPSVAPHVPLKALRADAQLGRVVFLGELFADNIMHGHKYPEVGEHVWASDRGWTAGGCLRAMAAARHMGAQVVSLCPIGQGPNARIITQALRRMNIIDAGPHLSGVDNGYRLQFSADEGYRMILRGTNSDWYMTLSTTTPLPSLASREWAESLQALGPSDILWIDGALMGHEPTAQALNEALRGLPEHVRVVFDGASDEGVPGNLPLDNVLVSLRVGNHTTFREHFGVDSSLARYNDRPEHQATALCLLSERHIVLRNADNEALFVRPTLDDARILSPSLTRVPGPPFSPTVRAERMADVHSGTLAACLALGMSAERGILLANCAAALGTPASLSTREAIEAAATGLKTRDQA